MANKFVRSMNDVNQKNGVLPLDLTNENDLISTKEKQHHIRRKNDYHCLTDNVKTIKLNGKELKPDLIKNQVVSPNLAEEVNGVKVSSNGKVTIDTGVMTVNGQEPDSTGEISLDTQFIVINDYTADIKLNVKITKGLSDNFKVDYNSKIYFSTDSFSDVNNEMRANVQFIYDFLDLETGEFIKTEKFGNDSNLIDFENKKIELVGSFTINHTGNALRIQRKPEGVYTTVLNITNKPYSPTKVLISLPLFVTLSEGDLG